MEKFNLEKYQPNCILAHELINKISVIVGNCDLLAEQVPDDEKVTHRIHAIRDLAKSMARDLNAHLCHLDAAAKAAVARRPPRTHANSDERHSANEQ